MDDALQKFSTQAGRVVTITGRKGLRVTIDPAVLETTDGSPVNGKIDVRIIELTNSNELFKMNAATMSNGRLLSSGGSYFIGMETEGQPLKIKRGKSLEVSFPLLSHDEMELFYGEREAAGEMNWKRAGMPLQEASFAADSGLFLNNRFDSDFPLMPGSVVGSTKPFHSLNQEVFYYSRKMTVRQLVDSINRRTQRVYIDTVYAWPRELQSLRPGSRVDTAYVTRLYGPPKQFFVKRCRSEEMEAWLKQKKARDSAIACWKPQSLAGQLQKYYAPSAVRALGWINCDRFYQYQEKADVQADLPITFNNSRIEYFLLFRNMSGLMNLKPESADASKQIFRNLPVGESVTLVGFAKDQDRVYQCREEFVVEKNKSLQLDFKAISKEELLRIFGKNVRI